MLYNPQLETFLCVVESGSFSKAKRKTVYYSTGSDQTDQFSGKQSESAVI